MQFPSSFLPAADVFMSDDDVVVLMDVPGLTEADLEIELTGDLLAVRGRREIPFRNGQTSERGPSWRRIERGFGRFERLLRVPEGLDPDAIAASLEHGVLTLRIPKPEPLKPRRITINGNHRELAGATA